LETVGSAQLTDLVWVSGLGRYRNWLRGAASNREAVLSAGEGLWLATINDVLPQPVVSVAYLGE
jgi:hypothetical protein